MKNLNGNQRHYKLFLDDIRNPEMYYSTEFIVARSYYEAINIIEEYGLPEFISFDHDLGDTNIPEKTGYDVAKYIVDYIIDNNITDRIRYIVHSANPVGKENIEKYLTNFYTAYSM